MAERAGEGRARRKELAEDADARASIATGGAGLQVDGDDGGWVKVAAFTAAACAISAVAVLTGPKNTHTVPTREIGLRRSQDQRASVGVA